MSQVGLIDNSHTVTAYFNTMQSILKYKFFVLLELKNKNATLFGFLLEYWNKL